MDPSIKLSEYHSSRPKAEENRKRSASGRLSPRSLFGNLKAKKPFSDEDALLRTSKNAQGWKPPLKVEPNENNSKFSSYDCDMETMSQSFLNHETNSLPNHNSIVNEPHYSGSYEYLYPLENGTFHQVESDEPIPGNSKEEYNSGIPKQNSLINDQDLDYSEGNTCQDLVNYINNSETELKEETDNIQINCGQNQEERNNFQPMTEKLDFPGNNYEYLKRTFRELQQPSPSRNEDQNCETNNSLSQDTIKLEKDDLEEYMGMKTQYKEDEHEYSEKSDSSESTIELSGSKKFPVESNDKESKNILPQEMNHGNAHEDSDKKTTECYITKEVDDSFDAGVTNSQFLQLENQISKSSIGMNMKNCYDNRPLLNNIETMKRYCTSLATQTEWQKNVLKCITRDIDDLNKAIVNVTGVLRSLRKDNPSAK